MNNLDALIIVRGAVRVSAQMRTRQGRAALKVVDRKIQSLLRKKAWRDAGGAVPVHMGSDEFVYPIADDPVTGALRELTLAVAADSGIPTEAVLVARNKAKAMLDEFDSLITEGVR